MNKPCGKLAVMRAMHAPVSPRHDVVSHARMLCVNFHDLHRFRHDARLRCIIRVRGLSFSFVTKVDYFRK